MEHERKSQNVSFRRRASFRARCGQTHDDLSSGLVGQRPVCPALPLVRPRHASKRLRGHRCYAHKKKATATTFSCYICRRVRGKNCLGICVGIQYEVQYAKRSSEDPDLTLIPFRSRRLFLTATLRPSTHTPVKPSSLSPLRPSLARVLMTVSSSARRYQWMSCRYLRRFMIGYITILWACARVCARRVGVNSEIKNTENERKWEARNEARSEQGGARRRAD